MDLLNISEDTLSDGAKEKRREALKLNDLFSSMGLTQHINEPTHSSGHTLDLVVTRSSDSIFHSAPYVDARLSDHWSLLFKVRMTKPPPVFKHTEFRRINDIDIEQFRKDISDSDLCRNPPLGDLASLVGMYNSCLSDLLDTHAPKCEKDLPVRPRQEWFNNDIKIERQLRRKYERLYKRTKLTCHEDMLRNQKNKVNIMCRSARCEHYSKKVQECGTDQKALFRIVKELFHDSAGSQYPEHDSIVSLVEGFADYFVGKIELIRAKLDAVDCDLPVDTPCDVSLSCFNPLSEDAIRKLILKSPTKSCSLDPIPSTLLKKCLDVLLPIITAIVNLSLSSGVFPDVYKLALVIPLLKKLGLELIFPSFRPVSNLMFLSKLSERAVASQLIDYCDTNHLKELLQSAYSSYHSTETALTMVHNDIMLAMDNQKVVLLLLLDLSAAFDTVDHSILLARLNTRFGIKGTALDWFRSYLAARTQSVQIDGTTSTAKELRFGFPQGSVLGPILFCIYTSPLGDLLRSHDIAYHFYADDSQVYLAFSPDTLSSQVQAFSKIESCAEDIRGWMYQK